MKRPATSGTMDQETPRTTVIAALRSRRLTRRTASTPTAHVGAPSCDPSPEASRRTAAEITMAAGAALPARDREAFEGKSSIWSFSCGREIRYKVKYVTRMDATDGKRN